MKYRLMMFAGPLMCASALLSQTRTPKPNPGPPAAPTSPPPTVSEFLKVTIYPSRNEVVPTGDWRQLELPVNDN